MYILVFVYSMAVFIHNLEAFSDDLLSCYTPVRLAYLVKEPKEGTNPDLNPIIFLHAIYCSKEYWFEIPQIVADRTGRKVYVLDCRDHGDSERSNCFNFDVNARDVVEFMDQFDIPKALVIGHSIGGESAIKVALKYPERIEKAIIEEFFVKTVSTELAHVLAKDVLLHKQAAQHVPHSYSWEAANQFVVDYVNADPFTAKAKGVNTVPVNQTRYIALKRSSTGGFTLKTNTYAVTYSLRSSETIMSNNTGIFNGPSLFIYGTESPVNVSGDSVTILQHFPNAQFIPVVGSNHEVHNNLPYEFTEHILRFIFQDHDK